jgi:hypothetical protein
MPIVISARVKALFALLAAVCCVAGLVAAGPGAAGAAPATVTYTNTQTIPVPPASSYAGSGGGDGWSLAFSATQVFNVFHHQATLQVECHKQSDAALCDPAFPITVTDAGAHNFGTSGHPGLFYDNSTKHLFIYATSASTPRTPRRPRSAGSRPSPRPATPSMTPRTAAART